MDYKDFQNRVEYGTKMFDAGNMQAALEAFTGLVNRDISDLDKSSMCLNIAVVYDKLGNPELCKEWYIKAIQLEVPHCRFEAQEYYAAYLNQNNHPRESLKVLESLSASAHLMEDDKVRIKQKIEELKVAINKPVYRRPGLPEEEPQ